MPRPRKWRKVCCLPEMELFGPLSGTNDSRRDISMTVDEYETIRLIDLEGLTQEECAERMQVARATVQSIYKEARGKIAQALVYGDRLRIGGGDYQLYNDKERRMGCHQCRRGLYGRCFQSGLENDPDDGSEHEENNR
ncbi:MAG: DUF134 domain-containing protein [Clostridiaceae bacterium]